MMIKSNNLLHVFKHNYVSPAELSEFLKANPNVERRIGCLPSDWLKNINKNDIPRITELVNDIFEKSSLELYSKSIGANITKTLDKLLKRSDIKIECAGTGSFKQCHKLTVGDYSYALSFFKPQKYCKAYTNQ